MERNSLRRGTLFATAITALVLLAAAFLIFTPPPPPALGQSEAPATPSSVSLTRADGTVTASWDTPGGATKYHVTYSSDGMQSWTAAAGPADNYSANSITITGADNAKSYVVGVRAGNGNDQWSGWRNSAAIGPYTPDPTPTPTPAPAPPDAPASVTVTRADGTVTASGYSVSNATKYHATYSSDNKQSWTSASDSHTGNSITISGADNAKTYYVGVRAGNAGGWSGWRNSEAAAPFVPAPTNLIITNGDGFFDLAWSTVTDATGYDVRSKINNSASRTSVATGLTTNSYRYTTSDVVNKLAVRATNASGSSTWTELSRGPNDSWLNTVQQSGASAQSAQGQSQLAAPASITVTRENNSRDEKLYVSWPAVSGASGYNLACAARPSTQPMTSLSWWHCGSVTSGPTTTFTVDRDKRGGFDQDLGYLRAYAVAVRAVTSNPAQASPWTMSTDALPARIPLFATISVSRAAGSVSISWARPANADGYKVYCATRENNVSSAHTVCANVANATAVNGRYSATITSWTDGGTTYAIDDTKIYDISITTTNAWGESYGQIAPLIDPIPPALTASNIGVTGATLTIANHTGGWWYKGGKLSGTAGSCTSVASGSTATLSGLEADTQYEYKAYSKANCASADLIATARFTTQPSGSGPAFSVTNVTSSAATLTLHNRAGSWWYKGGSRSGGERSCNVGPSNFVLSLSGLDANTEYTYRAYSDSSCGTRITSATFRAQS